MTKHLLFICFYLLLLPTILNAQDQSISGTITDNNGSPLPGVNVVLKGTASGTVSDVDGNYRLILPNKGDVLIFSFIGLATQEIAIEGRNVINVQMKQDSYELGEVVVVGYGSQSKRELSGSVAQVKGDAIRNVPVPSLESAIQGRTAGVFIEQGSGKPGQGIKVRVRGSSSITASNQPLFVVDGIPITTDNLGISTNEPTNPLADINFNDVESVEVLKDASASAIYGSRASNGVVIITTKKGKSGKTKFDLTYSRGFSEPSNKRNWMNASEYLEYMNEAFANAVEFDGYDSEGDFAQDWFGVNSKEDIYDIYIPGWRDGTDTNWQDQAFQRGSVTQLEASAAGGSQYTRFYIAGSYFDQQGILIGNSFSRIGGRINLDHRVDEKLSFSGNFSLTRSQNGRVANDNAFASPLQLVAMPAVQPVIDPATGELNTNTVYYNGLIEQRDAFFQTVVFRNISRISASYQFLPGLTFNSAFGLDVLNQDEDGYSGKHTQSGSPSGRGSSRRVGLVNYSLDNYFNYLKSFNDQHNFDIILGANYQKTEQESVSVQGEGFPSDKFTRLNDAADITFGNSFGTEFSLLSYFSRLNYDYDKKLLLSLNARVDGSSRFGVNNRYGFFPAASVGYVLTEDSFLSESAILSFLKVRASYGLTGNAEIGNFAWQGLAGGSTYGGQSGLQTATIANPDLKWETTRQLDFGLDFSLFRNRLSGEFDFYSKKTRDLLLNVTIPATTGFLSVLENIGELENKGFELVLNSENLVGNFKWSSSFNFALNKNKILNIGKVATGEDRVITAGINRVMVGRPIGVFWLPEYAGVDPVNGDALWFVNDPENLNDRSTTNNYRAANSIVAGNPNPKFFGGFSNNFTYSGFDLSILFQFVIGNDVYNDAGRFQFDDGAWFDNKDRKLLNRWREEGDKTDVPKPYFLFGNGDLESTRFLHDASYVRLKNLTLGYTLPSRITKAIKIDKLRFYAMAQNLLTFTKYAGWDPEVNFAGTNPTNQTSNILAGRDFYTAPQPKTVMFGATLSF